MKFKTILVDDEELAVKRLRRLLEPHSGVVEIVGSANDGFEAIQKIEQLRPNVVFLDVQMPELNGFEVIERLNHPPIIVFVTAYDEYALKAFETTAVDYLLKPVEPERLAQSIQKLRRLYDNQDGAASNSTQEKIDALLAAVSTQPLKRLQVRIGDRIRFVDVDRICFFRAADKYVEVHLEREHFLITDSLNALESKLPTDDFVRVHRSTVINLNYLGEFIRSGAGAYRVQMRNASKTILPVSRASKRKLGLS